MKACKTLIMLFMILMVSAFSYAASVATPPDDPGWPRVIQKNGQQLTIYQPQVDSWKDYANLHFRCAIAVKAGASQKEKFGVAEIEARTVTDTAARIVVMTPSKRELRFPNISEAEAASLRKIVDELRPPDQVMAVSLDRVLAYLDPANQPIQPAVDLNLDPPKIFYSSKPAILVMFLGEPELKPVVTGKNDLMFAVNTNWDIFYDATGQKYYLLNQDKWMSTSDAIRGPWAPAGPLPAGLSSLPADENWADVRLHVPGKSDTNPPVVLASTEPSELILTKGTPSFSPIRGTKLMRVTNTESILFLNSGDNHYYFLTAGRWFRTPHLEGRWSSASKDLPADFARIPDSDPAAFVKASVPGTTEAKDAVLLASVPATMTVDLTKPADVTVIYNGEPQFQPVPDTKVQYAVNSPNAVFLVEGSYYCCSQGVWYTGPAASGPWTYAKSVPQAIYSIPPSNPMYNVTYVTVQSSSPSTVVYSQTSGYSGEYVAATGVLMFGAGMILGAAIANNNHYYPPYPVPYSYGCAARYSYAYGGYYRAPMPVYGPYGGAGATAAYNPRTGTYSRGAYAYGPAGSASARQAYNPYTGARAAGGQVHTAYGSAGRGAYYNPTTGTSARGGYKSNAYGSVAAGQVSTPTGSAGRAAGYNATTGTSARGGYKSTANGSVAGGQVNTATGSAGRAAGYNANTGTSARGGYKSNANGSAAAVQTSKGTGAAAWDTASGQGAAAKTQSGNVYAGKDGNVYKKDSSGNWSTNSGSGWETVNKPQPQSASTSTQRESTQSLESQSQARQRGNQNTQISTTSRPTPTASTTSRPSGGGGRRTR